MRGLFTIIFFCLTLMNCQDGSANNNTPQADVQPAAAAAEPAPAPVIKADTGSLPLLPIEKAKEIVEKCDYIDLIFYQLDFSLNINEPKNAKGLAVSLLSTVKPPNPTCKEGFAYISFLSNGDIVAEAEVFFQKGCTYLVFKEDNKNVAICEMPGRGIKFFNSVITQQQNARKQQQGKN